MNLEIAVNKLKDDIKAAHDNTTKKIVNNIFRGHLRSISTDIENCIALFVSSLLPEHTLFLDPSIYVNKKNHRPDLLILDKNNTVKAMIEIKANFGWCRRVNSVIDKMIENHRLFAENSMLDCSFSKEETATIKYSDNVKLFLISCTSENCSSKNHSANSNYAKSNNVFCFNLFSGWYDSLTSLDVNEFAKELLKLSL
ncbi:MAG: hypothetical protein IJ309_01465 [Clostridia bacterium]|nr:hypothetical protein [Clostridia bacterium]